MIVKMVHGGTVRVGTIVDKDKDMQTISAVLRPGIRELTRGHQPGDIVARVDLDPYHRSFRNVCTHVLAPELTEPAIRDALRAGHAYVCHDWMCDPTGFSFELIAGNALHPPAIATIMGDEVKFSQDASAGGAVPRVLPYPAARGGTSGCRESRRMPGARRQGARRVPCRGLADTRWRGAWVALRESDLCAVEYAGGLDFSVFRCRLFPMAGLLRLFSSWSLYSATQA